MSLINDYRLNDKCRKIIDSKIILNKNYLYSTIQWIIYQYNINTVGTYCGIAHKAKICTLSGTVYITSTFACSRHYVIYFRFKLCCHPMSKSNQIVQWTTLSVRPWNVRYVGVPRCPLLQPSKGAGGCQNNLDTTCPKCRSPLSLILLALSAVLHWAFWYPWARWAVARLVISGRRSQRRKVDWQKSTVMPSPFVLQ